MHPFERKLKASIKHWEEDVLLPLLKGKRISRKRIMSYNCACCNYTKNSFDVPCFIDIDLCPISFLTKNHNCKKTPWDDVNRSFFHYFEHNQEYRKRLIDCVWDQVMFLWNVLEAKSWE